MDEALICHLQVGRLGDGELVANPASFSAHSGVEEGLSWMGSP